MKNHTKGLLVQMSGNSAPRLCIDGDKDWPIVVMAAGPTIAEAKRNEARMAECWNAMDGIDDPAAARALLDDKRIQGAAAMAAALKMLLPFAQCSCSQKFREDPDHKIDCDVGIIRRALEAAGEKVELTTVTPGAQLK